MAILLSDFFYFGTTVLFIGMGLIGIGILLLIIGGIINEFKKANDNKSSLESRLNKIGLKLMLFGGISLLLSAVLCSTIS